MNHALIRKFDFGHLPDGTPVSGFILTNQGGLEMRVLDYGCTITSLKVPDRDGHVDDIVLGFDTLDGYLQSPHYTGCIIGRCAGRIAYGQFELDGKTCHLPVNQPPHHLHGGIQGFHSKIWDAQSYENDKGSGVLFTLLSPDGDEGYPGNLSVEVRYFLSHANTLSFQYTAHTDAPTVVNLTQHSYFNLGGGRDTILKHALAINADAYLPIASSKVPTGEFCAVQDSVFDFRAPVLPGHVLLQPDPQIQIARGIDHCFVIRQSEKALSHAAVLMDTASGRRMDVYTTAPGLQVYTGNYLEGTGKKGVAYGPYSGIALETQLFPDAPHHPGFPSIILRPGEMYESVTLVNFSTI